jgi:hypothetical protein
MASKGRKKRSTNAFAASTWLPLNTFALLKQEAAKRGQNLSQYIGQLITDELRESGAKLQIK